MHPRPIADRELRSWYFDKPDEEAALFTANYNETFAAHWGAAVFTTPEVQEVFGELKDLLVADFCGVAVVDDETAGVGSGLDGRFRGATRAHFRLLKQSGVLCAAHPAVATIAKAERSAPGAARL